MEKRKLSFTALFLASCLFISGCEEPAKTFVASSRPVKTIVIGGEVSGDTRTFPAIVDAIQKAETSFRVSGKIHKIHVKEGDKVKKGQILAELDPTDFNITLKDRQASYDTAKANFDRAITLVKKGAISKVDHDNLRAKYRTAEATLEAAKQDLRYTKLKANFDANVSKRHVENFEEISKSQTIFSLDNVSSLKVKIDVPENLMIVIKKNHGGQRKLHAVFDNISNQEFPLSYLEASTKADPNTKTFKVTLKMAKPENYNVLPGMTATVFAQVFPDETQSASTVTLPVSAVIADNEKQATVWVVDTKTMTVKSKKVKPGLLIGDTMQVDGLIPGERVVIAGAAFLHDNMKVTLLQTGEQAQ
ncbi:MAG: efflux RND transporter periplasmic adaptor subunit [Gammaproteobacteria bacterium]|nr:efflux RND transporter periplasmic adaptor subunit [Gammaproteobacteria bacterium]